MPCASPHRTMLSSPEAELAVEGTSSVPERTARKRNPGGSAARAGKASNAAASAICFMFMETLLGGRWVQRSVNAIAGAVIPGAPLQSGDKKRNREELHECPPTGERPGPLLAALHAESLSPRSPEDPRQRQGRLLHDRRRAPAV